ncbi:D-Ala-D-Ala carboxypeptidase family metallohydrolase [Idiomarina abyssalis]|uniref:D-Ala-D-Ala carboxypeptidase family metallohydrolase n=1 Tax=Idiomarina abyssalis TaxID=86102 RepID=UPI003A950C4F
MLKWNPADTPNFSTKEMACKCGKCGGKSEMDPEFMARLQRLRDLLGPLSINSGYRCPQHPEEIKKARPGAHSTGHAADIKANNGAHRFKILEAAFAVGMKGIGVANGYIHVDDGHPDPNVSRPTQWKYG